MATVQTEVPKREILVTHKLLANTGLFHTLEPGSLMDQNDANLTAGKYIVGETDKTVKLIENYLGTGGKFSKIKIDDNFYFCLSSNLEETEEFKQRYKTLTPPTRYIPPSNFFPEYAEITDWNAGQIDVSLFNEACQTYYCCVEQEYDGSGVSEQLQLDNAQKSLFKGLKIIFSANGKKSTDSYILEFIEKYYLGGNVKEWCVLNRGCSNYYNLVTIPYKFLHGQEVIDYRSNNAARIEDGIPPGALNPKFTPNDIKYGVRFAFTSFESFKESINTLASVINAYGDKQQTVAPDLADQYIGPLTGEEYIQLIELDLKQESRKFNDISIQGNFLETIKGLLIMNLVDINTTYNDPLLNNIFFGLNERYEIIYIDILRNDILIPLPVTGGVFDREIGNYGVCSTRSGFFLYSSAASTSIARELVGGYNEQFNSAVNNTIGYEEFVKLFVRPDPKPINLPMRTIECAKNNMQRLYQAGVVSALCTETKALAEIVEFNVRKVRLKRNLDAREIASLTDEERAARQSAIDQQAAAEAKRIDDADGDIGGDFKQYSKELAGLDLTSFNSFWRTSLVTVKKFWKSVAFQRAFIKWIACGLKDLNNQKSMEEFSSWSKLRKEDIEEFLKKLFCNGTIENLIKALNAFKVPKFKPMNLNATIRKAIMKSIVDAIVQIIMLLIKEMLKAMENCGKTGKDNPNDPELDLGINAALDALLNGADDPYSNPSLGDVYDSSGVPRESTPENEQERAERKKNLQSLVSDITCILNSTELCRLFTEGTMSDETYGILRSLISKRYPSLAKLLLTKQQLISFFLSLGKSLGLETLCQTVQQMAPLSEGCLCEQGTLSDTERQNLASNNLTPEQIDELLNDAQNKRAKALDVAIEALDKGPIEFSALCNGVSSGAVNAAENDQAYVEQVTTAMEGSLAPIYQLFVDDLKAFAHNMTVAPRFTLSNEQLSQLNAAMQAKDMNLVKNVLKEAGILVAKKDDEGNIVYSGDETEENIVYVENTDYQTAEPIISPIFDQNYSKGTNTLYAQSGSLSLEFNISSKEERDKLKAILAATVDNNALLQIQQEAAEARAKIYASFINAFVTALFELAGQALTGGLDDDAGFWFGFGHLKSKYGKGDHTVWGVFSKIIAAIAVVFDLFSKFVDSVATGEPTPAEPPTITPNLATSATQRRLTGRDLTYQTTGYVGTAPSTYNANIDIASTSGRVLGTMEPFTSTTDYNYGDTIVANVSPTNIVNVTTRNDTQIAAFSTDSNNSFALLKAEEKAEYYNELVSSPKKYDAQGNILTEEDALVQAVADRDAANAEVTRQQEEIAEREREITADQRILSGQEPLSTSGTFDALNYGLQGIEDDIRMFKDSFMFKTIYQMFFEITEAMRSTAELTKKRVEAISAAKDLLANIEVKYPDYKLKYTYSDKIEGDRSETLELFRNNLPFFSTSFIEDTDQDVVDYIIENNLHSNVQIGHTLRQTVFENFIRSNGYTGELADYKTLESSFLSTIYNRDLEKINRSTVASNAHHETSVYRESKMESIESGNGTIKSMYTPNIKYLSSIIVERSDPGDNVCNINNHPLDLDKIMGDAIDDFKKDDCNHAPPNPNGTERDILHPVENAISTAFMIAAIRVYVYDYYLKGLFLFDRYNLGMTATDPMIEFLANWFEIEMRNLEFGYFDKFLDTVYIYCNSHLRPQVAELEVLYGIEGVKASYKLKKILFKRLIRDQILYVSSKIGKKLNSYASSRSDVLRSGGRPLFGNISRFFINDNIFIQSSGQFKQRYLYGSQIIYPMYYSDWVDGSQGARFELFMTMGTTTQKLIYSSKRYSSIDEMCDSKEYKLIFEYCFPIRKYISLVTMQLMLAGNARTESANTFLPTKAFIKTRHNSVMSGAGYDNPRDVSAASPNSPTTPGNGDEKSMGTMIGALIVRAIIFTPLDILKHTAETGDLNIFLSSLVYNIAKPITLALTNQIPMIPPPKDAAGNEIVPPRGEYNDFGFPKTDADTDKEITRKAWLIGRSLFTLTPLMSLGMAFWIFPSGWGWAYLGTLRWVDDMVDNVAESNGSATGAAAQSGLEIDPCIANQFQSRRNGPPPVSDYNSLEKEEYI